MSYMKMRLMFSPLIPSISQQVHCIWQTTVEIHHYLQTKWIKHCKKYGKRKWKTLIITASHLSPFSMFKKWSGGWCLQQTPPTRQSHPISLLWVWTWWCCPPEIYGNPKHLFLYQVQYRYTVLSCCLKQITQWYQVQCLNGCCMSQGEQPLACFNK